jgi:hypothetical protein
VAPIALGKIIVFMFKMAQKVLFFLPLWSDAISIIFLLARFSRFVSTSHCVWKVCFSSGDRSIAASTKLRICRRSWAESMIWALQSWLFRSALIFARLMRGLTVDMGSAVQDIVACIAASCAWPSSRE